MLDTWITGLCVCVNMDANHHSQLPSGLGSRYWQQNYILWTPLIPLFPFLPSQFHHSGTWIPGLGSWSPKRCRDGKSNHDYSVYSWSIYTHPLIYCDKLWKKHAQGTQKSVLQVDVKSVWGRATLSLLWSLNLGSSCLQCGWFMLVLSAIWDRPCRLWS